jgi:hypothetical protein
MHPHPYLLAALADDRRHQCPCGAAAERSNGLCRKCQARVQWRRKTTRTSRRAARRLTTRQARTGARALALAIRITRKGAET